MEKGELKKRANAYNLIPEITFLASADNDEWTNIEVVTLKQVARDKASKAAWEDPTVTTIEEIDQKVEELLRVQFNVAQEFVEIKKDKIIIGIDCDLVDDQVTDTAIMMLIELESFEPGTTHFFGEQVYLK